MISSSSISTKDTEVISKYFAHTIVNQGMDDSSDFQESKKSIKGPKQCLTTKTRAKKTVKKSKGQKDIRQVLKKNKNELVAFSKDFDTVCKKSGIDVDSEQLQLAIALSKSLQHSKETKTQPSGQTSQDRTNKIRSTLLEYGFKVPEIKINTNKRKRKWSISNSRLLLISEAERQQIIAEKFSQIIFDPVELDCNTYNIPVNTNSRWYSLTSNKTYLELIDDDIFYLNELNIERSGPLGSLLNDWSNIPGRPASPIQKKTIDLKINEITLNTDEVDILLSGALENVQSIIRNKLNNHCEPPMMSTSYTMESDSGDKRQPTRCLSPDIFDQSELSHSFDTASVCEETEQPRVLNTCSQKELASRKSDDIMDLTECVHQHQNKDIISIQLISDLDETNNTNFTRRNSNDYMEITNSIQSGPGKHTEDEKIDLTQGSDSRDNTIILQDDEIIQVPGNPNIDLTQSSCSNDSLPAIQISGKIWKPESNTIDNYVETQEHQYPPQIIDVINVDEVKEIPNSTKSASFEDFKFNHSDDEIIKPMPDRNLVEITDPTEKYNKLIDSSIINIQNYISEDAKSLNSLGKKDDVSIDYDDIYNNLTQQEDTIEQKCLDKDGNDKITSPYNELTEIPEPATQSDVFEISDEEFNYSIHQSVHTTSNDLNSPSTSNEQKHFDVGGVTTIMDDLSALDSNATNESSFSKDVSVLPVVEITGNRVKIMSPKKSGVNTPVGKSANKFELVQTPNNSEYYMKTDQVTPMQEFDALSTPNINKELEKYGLKPFKRKRAIQLLTHLYDQTHPVLEQNAGESPVKKSKTVPEPRKIFSKVTEGQKEATSGTMDKENEFIPRDLEPSAVVGDIPCDPADWVFQKREKAKVHSCRLPLHVAFHNHVASLPDLRAAILRYEPVDIDVVHRSLVAHGHRYDPKDLLKFMDKKCITVKTADNNARNKRNDKK